MDSIPSPVYVNWTDQNRIDTEADGVYPTCSRDPVPLPLTDFRSIDQGNCTPRYLRLSTYILPHTDDLASASHLPLGLIAQPFAKPRAGEQPVPLSDFSESSGPPRCDHCRAYINAWCAFTEGGQKFTCNLCNGATDVPPEYYCHLDMHGRRLDQATRPELCCGSVDFAVPAEYWVQPTNEEVGHAAAEPKPSSTKHATTPALIPQALARKPEPMKYVFAIDVSWAAGRSGMLKEVIAGLKEVFYGHEEAEDGATGEESPSALPCRLPAGAKVAIITFDRTVHFYNLKASFAKQTSAIFDRRL